MRKLYYTTIQGPIHSCKPTATFGCRFLIRSSNCTFYQALISQVKALKLKSLRFVTKLNCNIFLFAQLCFSYSKIIIRLEGRTAST
jgi:hypothetical protein